MVALPRSCPAAVVLCLLLPPFLNAQQQQQQQQHHPCLPCHSQEVENFSRSAMGKSIAVPSDEPAGQFNHPVSNGRVRVFWKDRQLHHEIQQSGLSAEHPAAYSIGFGNIGKSYLVEIAGRLFQSPAAFYTAKSKWAESPGFESDPVLDFWRPIDDSCLSCHSGSVQRNQNHVDLTAIGCDRCHGDADRHLKNPVPGSIINPSKLALRQRDSVCEQCHLEGATIVLNPDRHWGEFQPGKLLEQFQTTYILESAANAAPAVSHAEQLALSRCKRADPTKLWCGTCHDAHSPAGDHRAQISRVCQTCHAGAQLSATHRKTATDCVGCHMPKIRAADISHAAITDHRILRRPGEGMSPHGSGASERLVPWQTPPAPLTQRNLGLALFNLARSGKTEGNYPEAFRLLAASSPAQGDAAVWAAEGYMLLGSGHPQPALECFRKAVTSNQQSAEYRLDLGVALEATGDNAAAEIALRESIRCNPTDYRPYQAMAALLKKEGKSALAAETVQEFLRVNPQSLLMRLHGGG